MIWETNGRYYYRSAEGERAKRISAERYRELSAEETTPEPTPEPTPELAPVPSAEQVLDLIRHGRLKATHYEGNRSLLWELPSGARLWEIRVNEELKGYAADSESAGYLEQMLKYHFSPRDALRRILIELERAEELSAEEPQEGEIEIDFDEEEETPSFHPEIRKCISRFSEAKNHSDLYTAMKDLNFLLHEDYCGRLK